MAGRKGKPVRPVAAPSPMRFLPLAMLLALVIFVGGVLSISLVSPEAGSFHYPLGENQSGCSAGQIRPCSVDNCSGMSTCLPDGTWSVCTWQRICSPDARLPCIQNGCAYAYKACNRCGSGYGACSTPSAPQNSTAG